VEIQAYCAIIACLLIALPHRSGGLQLVTGGFHRDERVARTGAQRSHVWLKCIGDLVPVAVADSSFGGRARAVSVVADTGREWIRVARPADTRAISTPLGESLG